MNAPASRQIKPFTPPRGTIASRMNEQMKLPREHTKACQPGSEPKWLLSQDGTKLVQRGCMDMLKLGFA